MSSKMEPVTFVVIYMVTAILRTKRAVYRLMEITDRFF